MTEINLIYLFCVLLTGIHLMRTGLIEANLLTLNQGFKLSYIDELIARKLSGPETSTLEDGDVGFYLKSDAGTCYQENEMTLV